MIYLTPKKNSLKTSWIISSTHITSLSLKITKLLPYIVVIIFTLILLQYARIKLLSQKITFSSKNEQEFLNRLPSHKFCTDIKDPECSSTKLLVREIIDYLRYTAGRVECSLSFNQYNGINDQYFINKCVHLNTITDYFVNERSLIKPIELQDIAVDSVLKAIIHNSNWNIILLNSSYNQTDDIDQVKLKNFRKN